MKNTFHIDSRLGKLLEIVPLNGDAIQTIVTLSELRNKIKNFHYFLFFLFQLELSSQNFHTQFGNRSGFVHECIFFFPFPAQGVDFAYVNSISMGKTDNLFSGCTSRFCTRRGAVWEYSADQYTRSITSVVALYSRSFRFEWKSNQGPLSVANNEFDEITTPFWCTIRPIGQYHRVLCKVVAHELNQ